MDINLLQETCERLEAIADTLYQGYVSQGIADMNSVISDLAVISTWIIDEELQVKLVNNALAPILSAMEAQDATELADLITYELLEILGELE